ncbi:MATH domain and coiled-coil domain-containing protein At3g58270-like [Neltuma alba]|uniref:MATH domain and coiled-coil domain-containing protein At3g58270-like n=1 Tax=Neltuma alba TaxID=207710 RepID=UPI0010A45F65|nr:MATH domain and coiled-coil domain-containing protein At3g58270-like [Prosopis alba]XP_028777633.1 MATH domain and coiled-coil domain-containing protein At3g58270-like [Prosopis alba]XP_028777634.1 MATH domain and coiled-coil domain-containing protein At3g58270-like [Prosopis alba]
MENPEGNKGHVFFDKFTWKIENFSKQNATNLRSKPFKICGFKWKLHVHPLRRDVDNFSVYLTVADSLPPYGWSRNTYFKLVLINQIDPNKSIIKETQQKFKGGHRSWGSFLVTLKDFYDPKQGYLVKNTCIIEAHIGVPDVAPKIQATDNNLPTIPESNHHQTEQQQSTESTTQNEDQATTEYSDEISETPSSLTSSSGHAELDEVQCSDLTLRDLIDVSGFGPDEAAYVPLLEEACTWHPQLINSQRDRTRWFKLWAFTSLGQVLYFLKTKKVKDMDEDGCKYLQGLWDELVKSSGFNLSWLEPYVQSALSAKNYLPKAETVEKAAQKMTDLEIKVKKLKGELAVAEMEHELARRELVEIKGSFHELDLNAALDYAMF